MKILYCHDHRLKVYEGKFYSNGSFSTEVFNRYLSIFDEITFLSRQEEMNVLPKNLTLVAGDRLKFEEVEDFNSLKKIKNIRKARTKIKQEVMESDAVISRLPSTIGEMSIRYAKKLNKPYLIEVVGCPWDTMLNHGKFLVKLLAPKSYLTMRYSIKNANYVSYITKRFLQGRYSTKGKEYIAPNVFIKTVSETVLENKLTRIENKTINDTFVFGLVGSLDVAYKGHLEVLRAFSMIKKEYPEISFRIEFLGGGNGSNLKKETEKLGLNKNIIFKGTLPSGAKVFDWMDSLDITLQPSKAEAQGRAIIEAMSRGNPIIASKVGGIVELIDDEYLITAGNYIDLKDKIIKMIFNKDIMVEQSKKNFNEAKFYYEDRVNSARNMLLLEFKREIMKQNKEDKIKFKEIIKDKY